MSSWNGERSFDEIDENLYNIGKKDKSCGEPMKMNGGRGRDCVATNGTRKL